MPNVGLATVEQQDFAAGSFQGVARALIPQNGIYKAINWLTDDDGSLYRRGGTEAHSNAAFGTSGRFIYDAVLSPGQRTLFASPSAFAALDADDQTPRSLGGAGMAGPGRANELKGFVFVDGGAIYAGSRKTADYSTGTVAVTNGSPTVTGSSTVWSTNVDAGMLLRVAGAGRYYIVKSVDSNTQITLTENYQGSTLSGQSYALTRLGTTSVAPYRGTLFAVVANRLISIENNQIFFANVLDPHTWQATNFHQVPGGVTLAGGVRAGDKLLAFGSNGIWMVSNLALELTDAAGNPQQRLEQTSQDIVLWGGNAGVESWEGQVIVPALDGLWLVSALGQPITLLSRSIAAQWRSYVKAGYQPGQAEVHRSHYVVPIIDGSNVVQDELACRLDRPEQTPRGIEYPWTFMDDTGGRLFAFAVRSSARPPRLLAVSSKSDARVVNADTWWAPDAAHKNDHDGTTHHVDVITKNFEPGNLVTWRRAQVRYEGLDAGTDLPTIQGYYSVGVQQGGGATWGSGVWGTDSWVDSVAAEYTQLSSSGTASDGRNPQGWSFAARARYIRLRFLSSAPWASLTLRDLKLSFRQSPKG